MAASDSVELFLKSTKEQGHPTVYAQPKLDLDLYTQNYAGRTRFERLLFIGRSCKPLCVDALRAAVDEAKEGKDVLRYKEAWDSLRQVAPDDSRAVRDENWIETTEATNQTETNTLEGELRQYRNNLIKESIRMGHEDLGAHLEATGNLKDAHDSYAKMRQDVTSTKHIIDCCQRLIGIALQRRDWTNVITQVNKIFQVINEKDQQPALRAYLFVVMGIGLLGQEKYEAAANCFLQVDAATPPDAYNQVATPNDVALFGALLSLATLDKAAIQEKILDNSNFRPFLETEPHARKAISLYLNGRYPDCLTMLESIQADALLDIYLSRHIETLYSNVRRKCIVAYILPFSCVSLDSLDGAFGKPDTPLEAELVEMIRDGSLKARIDLKEKVLVAVQLDPRLKMQQKALDTANRYEENATERLRRINLIAAGLNICHDRRLGGSDELIGYIPSSKGSLEFGSEPRAIS